MTNRKMIEEGILSDKVSKYLEASAFIKWYKENKARVAELAGVDESRLPSLDEILKISRELITNIINPQSGGDIGNEHRKGFKPFENLEYILIHDFLHNLYQVDAKDFSKDLSTYGYSVSEIIEEMECLAIEEDYMKWFNLKVATEQRITRAKAMFGIESMSAYTSSEFTHQNINQLASFLIPTILKEQPEAIEDYLADPDGPMVLEVYGKAYDVRNTGFEPIFTKLSKIYPDTASDDYDEGGLGNADNIHKLLRDAYFAGVIIRDTGGDRANYPSNTYWGSDGTVESDEIIEKVLDELKQDGTIGWRKNRYIVAQDDDLEDLDDEDEYEGIAVSMWEEADYIYDDYKVYSISDGDFITDFFNEFSDEYLEKQNEMADDLEMEIYDYFGKYRIDEFMKLTLSEKMQKVSSNNDASAILRRYFRQNAMVGNRKNIYDTEQDYLPIGKNPLTDNAKRLKKLLNGFLRDTISNIQKVKSRFEQFHKDGNVAKSPATKSDMDLAKKVADVLFSDEGWYAMGHATATSYYNDCKEVDYVNGIIKFIDTFYPNGNPSWDEEMLQKSAHYDTEEIKRLPTYEEASELLKKAYKAQMKMEMLCSAMDKIDYSEEEQVSNFLELAKEHGYEVGGWRNRDIWPKME